jgi:hypothetical protein
VRLPDAICSESPLEITLELVKAPAASTWPLVAESNMATWVIVPQLPPDAVKVTVALVLIDPPDADAKVTDCLLYPLPLTSSSCVLASKSASVSPAESVLVAKPTYTVAGAVVDNELALNQKSNVRFSV